MATTGVERIVNWARQESHTRYMLLMHHFTVDNLRACFESLDAQKAIGVDGITKAMYRQDLEANLQGLHDRLHQMSYRPKPVRRVGIPKDDGSTRPLRISCVEDKIVADALRIHQGQGREASKSGKSLPIKRPLWVAFCSATTKSYRAEVRHETTLTSY